MCVVAEILTIVIVESSAYKRMIFKYDVSKNWFSFFYFISYFQTLDAINGQVIATIDTTIFRQICKALGLSEYLVFEIKLFSQNYNNCVGKIQFNVQTGEIKEWISIGYHSQLTGYLKVE